MTSFAFSRKIIDARIIRDHFEDRYPSDHFPYMVELDFVPRD
jgi:exonuclease III